MRTLWQALALAEDLIWPRPWPQHARCYLSESLSSQGQEGCGLCFLEAKNNEKVGISKSVVPSTFWLLSCWLKSNSLYFSVWITDASIYDNGVCNSTLLKWQWETIGTEIDKSWISCLVWLSLHTPITHVSFPVSHWAEFCQLCS